MSKTKDWRKICADCQEGKPPKDCEYYGEPRGCNAPTYGGPPPRYYEELREENARLRAALKVAEEALVKLQAICRQTEYIYGRVICDDALSAILDEGGAK